MRFRFRFILVTTHIPPPLRRVSDRDGVENAMDRVEIGVRRLGAAIEPFEWNRHR